MYAGRFTEDQVGEIREAFDRFDSDQSGSIDPKELELVV